ncbi:MAG: glycosyltransferase family 1 protein [Actinomycetota bacterium]|nr:glycosyltransferase family 1 protein [Actinomycetota bacterium]
MSMRVAYDREMFVRQERGGITRYFSELIRCLADHPELGIEPSLTFSRCSNEHLLAALPEMTAAMPTLRLVPRGVPRMVNSEDLIKDSYLRYRAGSRGKSEQFDWLHATSYRPMKSDLAHGTRIAVSIYDMFAVGGEARRWADPHRGKRELASRADLVIAISQTTAGLFNELLPGNEAKVVVTPLGVRSEFFEQTESVQAPIAFPYLLFVGARALYKRFDLLCAALELVRNRGHDIGLVVAGAPVTDEELAMVGSAARTDRFCALTPTDAELAALYQRATAFVFPSEMEGFGLPLLEAAAAGCPLIASDIPIFHEVAGDAGWFFSSGDAESLAVTIESVLNSSVDRVAKQGLGRERAQESTWMATATATANAYLAFA